MEIYGVLDYWPGLLKFQLFLELWASMPQCMTLLIQKTSLIQKLLKWLYNSPFELVICTQDGSGVENWLRKAIRKSVRVEILLNGIPKYNYKKTKIRFSKKIKYITFLGKLEHAKGAEQFVGRCARCLKKIIAMY